MDASRILILSDSHGRTANVLAAIRKEKPFDLLVHLGDIQGSTEEIQKEAGTSCFFVMGNCDYDPNLPSYTVFQIGRHKCFAAHGHRQHVSFGTENLEKTALENDCQVAMYGHTHVPDIRQKKNLLILNPGSISLPRQTGFAKTYILLSVDEAGELVPEIRML